MRMSLERKAMCRGLLLRSATVKRSPYRCLAKKDEGPTQQRDDTALGIGCPNYALSFFHAGSADGSDRRNILCFSKNVIVERM